MTTGYYGVVSIEAPRNIFSIHHQIKLQTIPEGPKRIHVYSPQLQFRFLLLLHFLRMLRFSLTSASTIRPKSCLYTFIFVQRI